MFVHTPDYRKRFPAYRLDPWGWPIEFVIGRPILNAFRVLFINIRKFIY